MIFNSFLVSSYSVLLQTVVLRDRLIVKLPQSITVDGDSLDVLLSTDDIWASRTGTPTVHGGFSDHPQQ